jgi:16S rRNA U516 pseudouridylate synthase RsuA-like enzyme
MTTIHDIIKAPFNQGEAHHPTKGKKGFQPKEVKSNVQLSFKVTPAQAEAIRRECKERGVTISQLVRAGIACYVLPPAQEGYINIDADQLSFWD